ncbi:MAG: GNAT family N-acetyltransferase [Zetaproteobacteria bacterium]|nr:GNAT family N-acetyltransferase [Zetaproteobacteria bacterium]
MDVMNIFRAQAPAKRDLLHYVHLEEANKEDDVALIYFLIHTFEEVTNARIAKGYEMVPQRRAELALTRERRQQGLVKVLKLDTRIIGTYCLLGADHFADAWEPSLLYFNSFAIHQDFHGTQLSQLLLADAHVEALKSEANGIGMTVFSELTGLMRFYEKWDFVTDPDGDTTSETGHLLGYRKSLSIEKVNELLKLS